MNKKNAMELNETMMDGISAGIGGAWYLRDLHKERAEESGFGGSSGSFDQYGGASAKF